MYYHKVLKGFIYSVKGYMTIISKSIIIYNGDCMVMGETIGRDTT